MFDGQFLGFVAVGEVLYFRSTAGADLQVLHMPEDCDAHVLAAQLNAVCNAVIGLLKSMSNFRL